MIWIYTMLLATAFFFLGSRTAITAPLWTRFPPWLYKFMACPMCVPVWYTFFIVTVALNLGYSYPGFIERWHAMIVVPLSAIITTPIVAGTVEKLLPSQVEDPPEEGP